MMLLISVFVTLLYIHNAVKLHLKSSCKIIILPGEMKMVVLIHLPKGVRHGCTCSQVLRYVPHVQGCVLECMNNKHNCVDTVSGKIMVSTWLCIHLLARNNFLTTKKYLFLVSEKSSHLHFMQSLTLTYKVVGLNPHGHTLFFMNSEQTNNIGNIQHFQSLYSAKINCKSNHGHRCFS